MRVNWGALGVIIGLILVVASIAASGLIAEKSLSRFTAQLTSRLTTLQEQIPIMQGDIERAIIAQGYTFSKVYSEKRTVTLEDLKEGYALANEFTGK